MSQPGRMIGAALLAAVLGVAACSGDKDGPDRSPEVCDDGVDNDLDGFADCEDDDCFVACVEDCTNGVDDDDDGLVDCFDPACFGGLCTEICDDGGDNDLDGVADCLDADCMDVCPEACDDGIDNNGDGQVDCDDPECDSTCDADGDGAVSEAFGGDDCDDADPNNFPDNSEVCDEVDNDCDELIDDSDPDVIASTNYYVDGDGDGFGDAPLEVCDPPAASSTQSGDCDDSDPAVNPDALEVCGGADDDCDGLVDDDDPSLDLGSLITWYPDGDGDGWGVPGPTIEQCAQPPGHADNDLDCNDSNPAIGGEQPWLLDGDGDGFGAGTPTAPSCSPPTGNHVAESVGVDCDDTDNGSYPGAAEICGDGIDQDCDGVDTSCAVDLAVTVERGGVAVVDALGGTFDGTEYVSFTGNASGYTYCEYTYVTQDWDHAPAAVGPDPVTVACADPDGNACLWNFTVVIDQGVTTGGTAYNCEGWYGRTPISINSPSGYGWTDAYFSGGVDFGGVWMYYDPNTFRWLGLLGGSYTAASGDFDYAAVTDTGQPPPP